MIPYGRQSISEEDIQAVLKVLKSDFLTQGPEVDAFEGALAAYCGATYAVAVSNATAALHLACLAADLRPGDRLWTTPNTFVASANCGLYCGANVDFVDIDPVTSNMDAGKLAAKLEKARNLGTLPKVVVPVHFAGQPCDMRAIRTLSEAYGFTVIEDASHAMGAEYLDGKTGSCAHSDMTVFSFHPVKIITTGEGGVVTTNRPELHSRLARLRSHGITRDPAAMEEPSEGPWYYEQIDLGFNYRITDIQAALGASQLKRLDAFVESRNRLASRYDAAFTDLPLQLPARSEGSLSARHLYVIRVRDGGRADRAAAFAALRAQGIMVNVHYIPVHLQPHYRRMGFRPGDFPEAERHYREAISLPMFAALSESDQDRVIAAVRGIFA